ncbi:hypothetical protein [Bacillus weihaiensis]|uniref:Uncharacterized protein n=1 Tax=Bacillus weihaiensis TaxID=1547283 RepID=A0A1L3MP53_9BACI|nr:hypothetical protein [Bacillus weihaiensis]APH03984.1 hypothetical protein A9C19_04095 [Bacillus weihaiensis]
MELTNLLMDDASRFRADEEDVFAYVHSIVQNTNKQELVEWLKELSPEELQAIVTPFLTNKVTEKIAQKEFE